MFKYLLLFAIYTFCVTPVFEAGERVKGSELRCKYRFTITDLNNDGLQDIVVLSGGGDRAYIHYNEGSIGKPSFSFSQRLFINFSELEPNLVTLSYSIQAFDWDKDGDPDFILSDGNGYNYGGVYLATNIGSASNYLLRPGHKLANSTTTTYCRAADLDRDGLNDILYNDKGRILWRRNLVANDSATKVDSAVVLRCTGIDSISSVTGSRFETADLNGDSLVDIITFGGTGNVVRFYAGSTDPDSFSTPVTIFSFPKGVDLSICDWNNNGINDILVLDSSIGALLYFQNKGTASAPVFSTLADDTIRGSELSQIEEFMNFQLLDWNKDNRMDIVIGGGFDVHCSGSNPALKLYLNQSSEGIPKFENGHIIRPLTNSNGGGYWNGGRFPAIADYNNDGYLDMFATWNYSTSGQKNINYFTGNNSTQSSYFFAKESVSVFPLYGSAEFFASPVVVDWNKDGLTDLLISTRNDADNTVKIFYYP
ncbi:MAG: VCBS repeat-containing protein, partial [Fibrobacteres bacterium]|nr:VCBS repeat-containing protein [Fibrobacterota bacterium]